MAKKNIVPGAAKKASELYLRADELYEKISSVFERIESGEITYEKEKFKFIKLQGDLKMLQSILTKIDTDILEDYVNNETIQTMEHNITYMMENSEYIEKRILADQYFEDLRIPVKKYIRNIAGDPSNYKKWAKDEDELTRKFIGMLTHPDYIDSYIHQIKRMALGTMSLKEFKKIFEATKHKMIPLWESFEFQPFSEYKKYI